MSSENHVSTLLCFDNGLLSGVSRGVEFSLTNQMAIKDVLWSSQLGMHRNLRGRSPFTTIQGSIQKLDNGNYLVNYGTEGVIEEQTPDNEVVWRYGREKINRASRAPWAFYRVNKYSLDYCPQLSTLKKGR